jgi:hypothetical protein
MASYSFFAEDPANVKFGDTPGYGNIAFAPIEDFTVIGEPVGPFTTEGASKTHAVTHTFPAGKGFIEASLYREGAEMKGESKGDVGFQSGDYTVSIFIVGDTPEIREKVENMANRGHIVLVESADCADGTLKQLGCKCNPAVVAKWEFMSGNKLNGGKKGYKVDISSPCLFDYTSTVTYKP